MKKKLKELILESVKVIILAVIASLLSSFFYDLLHESDADKLIRDLEEHGTVIQIQVPEQSSPDLPAVLQLPDLQ